MNMIVKLQCEYCVCSHIRRRLQSTHTHKKCHLLFIALSAGSVFRVQSLVAARFSKLETQTAPSPLPREPLFIYLPLLWLTLGSERAGEWRAHPCCDCLFNKTHARRMDDLFVFVWMSLRMHFEQIDWSCLLFHI